MHSIMHIGILFLLVQVTLGRSISSTLTSTVTSTGTTTESTTNTISNLNTISDDQTVTVVVIFLVCSALGVFLFCCGKYCCNKPLP